MRGLFGLLTAAPDLRDAMEKLRDGRTAQNLDTLSKIWNRDPSVTRALAGSVAEVGFFERRGSREEPEYWVPFLYRGAPNMIQGTAE